MTLSGGQKQRLFIALALINDPEVVFLDELTTGLDPQARRAIWELVRGIRERGKTVLMTTHLMEEAERLCDRVAIIERGKIIDIGTPQELVRRHCPAPPGAFGSIVLPVRSPGIGATGTVLRVELPVFVAVLIPLTGVLFAGDDYFDLPGGRHSAASAGDAAASADDSDGARAGKAGADAGAAGTGR